MIGDLAWIKPHLADFGLHDFQDVNRELWHWQPVDIPNSRSRYVDPRLWNSIWRGYL